MKKTVIFILLLVFGSTVVHWADEEETKPEKEVAQSSQMFRGNPARTGYYPGGLDKSNERRKSQMTVFVASLDQDMFALDAKTGKEKWKIKIGRTQSTPVIVNGALYIGSSNRKVYCIDAMIGKIVWEFETSGSIVSTPTVADGKVFISSGNLFYALGQKRGEKIWQIDIDNPSWSSAAMNISPEFALTSFPTFFARQRY